MALKIYRTIVHGHQNTRYAYVCASSKSRVAEILNVSLNQLNKYGCSALDSTDEHMFKCKHLRDGEVFYEDVGVYKSSISKGMSVLDLHRISALGYIDAALQSLNQCEMPDRAMSNRLGELRGQLKDLKDDAKEALEYKYRGR